MSDKCRCRANEALPCLLIFGMWFGIDALDLDFLAAPLAVTVRESIFDAICDVPCGRQTLVVDLKKSNVINPIWHIVFVMNIDS